MSDLAERTPENAPETVTGGVAMTLWRLGANRTDVELVADRERRLIAAAVRCDALRESYDDLCEVAADMAAALRPFAKTSDLNCTCGEERHDSCQWCAARHALRAYDEAER